MNGNFRVDGWLVQPNLNLISKNGTSVRLEPKVMQVLTCLSGQAGETVSKERLLQEVWPDTFVADDVLKRSIFELRRALQDDAREPRIIETIPKRGYRIVLPVDRKSEEYESEPNSSRSKFRRSAKYAGASAAALVIALGLLTLRMRFASRPQVMAFNVAQLSKDGQVKYDPLGTDGTRIYTSESLPGQHVILVQVPLRGGQPVPITTSLKSPRFFDVSPDGTELLVGNHEDLGRFTLWVMSVTGTVTRQIGELQADDYAAWTPDSDHVIFSQGPNVFFIGEDGQGLRKLFTAPGQVSFLSLSPDARILRFAVRDMPTRTETLWEASANGEHVHPLLSKWTGQTSACCGRWTHDGAYYVFESTREGRTDLWVMPGKRRLLWLKNDEPVQLTSGPLEFSRPLPANSAGIFAIGTLRRSEVVRYDMQSKEFVPYLFGVSADAASFSKDGEWVSYVSYPDGTLWRSRIDGSDQLQVTHSPIKAYMPRWSPEGQRIAFMGKLPGQPWSIYTVSADASSVVKVLEDDKNLGDPNWSPDGNALVFGGSGVDDGTIRVLDLKTKQVSQVPGSEKLFSPRWSPAGRYITAITCHRPYRLMLFDSETEKWKQLTDFEMSFPSWSHDGKYIYFSGHGRVARVSLSDAKIETIVDLQDIRRLPVGSFGYWGGLAPDDSPLLSRDISTQEIYSIKWQFR